MRLLIYLQTVHIQQTGNQTIETRLPPATVALYTASCSSILTQIKLKYPTYSTVVIVHEHVHLHVRVHVHVPVHVDVDLHVHVEVHIHADVSFNIFIVFK